MPRKKVTDPITDQETTFARLFMSGTMTDSQAAEAAGLNPDAPPPISEPAPTNPPPTVPSMLELPQYAHCPSGLLNRDQVAPVS
jgi:hypothetical protein